MQQDAIIRAYVALDAPGMTTCCVIGGAGFIGSHVTRLLANTERKVIVLGRRATPARRLPDNVSYVSGDYGNVPLLTSLLLGVDELIDLAYSTVPQTSFADPVYDIGSNLPVAVDLLKEAVSAGLKKVLLVSSGGTVYGLARSMPIPENHPTNPVSPYGITKLTIEKYGLMFHHNFHLPVVIVRPGNAYGEDQPPFLGQGFLSTAMHSICQGRPIMLYGENGTTRDYLHVSDMASGIVAALSLGSVGETYNIGSGHGRSNRDVLHSIEPLVKKAGRRLAIEVVPHRTFDVPANVLDATKLGTLGWQPKVAFEDGIGAMWAAISQKYAGDQRRTSQE